MLLYELNHREQSSAFESRSLKTTVAELGHTKSSASFRHLLRRCVAHALVGLVILSTVGIVSAQDQQRSWRLTYQDRTSKTNPVTLWYETRQGAEGQQNLCQSVNASSKGLGLTPNYSDFRIEQVAQKSKPADQETAISYAGEAIRALRGRMQKGSGRLGDTLRDYANVVKGSLKNANQLRSTLLSMTGSIERRTFDQINQKIDDYNKQADAYNQVVRAPETVLRLQKENGGKIVGPQDYPTIDRVATVRPDQLKGTLSGNIVPQPPAMARLDAERKRLIKMKEYLDSEAARLKRFVSDANPLANWIVEQNRSYINRCQSKHDRADNFRCHHGLTLLECLRTPPTCQESFELYYSQQAESGALDRLKEKIEVEESRLENYKARYKNQLQDFNAEKARYGRDVEDFNRQVNSATRDGARIRMDENATRNQ